MSSIILSACVLVAVTVALHAAALAVLLRRFMRLDALPPTRTWPIAQMLLRMVWWLFLIHLAEILIWGLFYWWRGCLADAETAFYFSGTTYTTIGYGDVVLAKPWRLLAPIEGLTGILMCGFSTGYFFVVVNHIHQSGRSNRDRSGCDQAPQRATRQPHHPAVIIAIAVAVWTSAAQAAEAPTNTPAAGLLLIDSLGHTVRAATNQVPQPLQPPAAIGLPHQLPSALEGAKASPDVLSRMEEGRAGRVGVQLFPAIPPRLPSYLFSVDEYGNTAIRPGALITYDPLDVLPQYGKYWASEYGLRYSLDQTLTYVSMTDVVKGDNTLGYYTFDLKAKWAIFDAPGAGTAGWISSHIEAKSALGGTNDTQSAKSNLGTVTDPTGIWSSVNGIRVPELAWQESFLDGAAVLVAGMIDQEDYLDKNAYAHTGRGQFINSALINSMVLPLKQNNFGLNLQCQPRDDWYAMIGASVGNAPDGQLPWTDFSWHDWSLIGELGYAPDDFLGLGPGIYRLQPFVGQMTGLEPVTVTFSSPGSTNSTSVTYSSLTNSPVQAGLCFNLQQQLGPRSPFGCFGRFGFGGAQVAHGAAAQIGTGFVMQAPLKHVGLVPRLSNDLLGVGLVWSQPSATTKTIYHHNEYALEAFYALQLTPLMKLQPDIQYVWNPAFNPANNALVAQLQLVFSW